MGSTRKRKTKPCIQHSPYYDLQTGGLRCRKCKLLLNDVGKDYSEYEKMNSEQLYRVIKAHCAIEQYAGKYEISFQFWGDGFNQCFVNKDDVEMFSGGQFEKPIDAMEAAVNWLKKVNKKQ